MMFSVLAHFGCFIGFENDPYASCNKISTTFIVSKKPMLESLQMIKCVCKRGRGNVVDKCHVPVGQAGFLF